MNIVWREQAEADLDALTDYIAKDNPQAALHVYDTILAAVDRLASFPTLGRDGRVERTRELIISAFPYIVVYTIIREEIQILAIQHASRKWPTKFPTD